MTTPYGYTHLSLDAGAAYTLGALNVTGSTSLHTTALSSVGIISSTGADILRVTDNGDINISKSNMALTTAITPGLLISSKTLGGSVLFKDNMDVYFYGQVVDCSGAVLTAYQLVAMNGMTITCNNNRIVVNTVNTTITGALVSTGATTCNALTVNGL